MTQNNKMTLMVKLDDKTYKRIIPICEVPTIGSKRITNREKIWLMWSNNGITDKERDLLLKKNEDRLIKKRKYEKGELITSIDELLSYEFVYIYEKLWHKKWFLNLQLGLLVHWITHNKVRKAIKKENSTQNS